MKNTLSLEVKFTRIGNMVKYNLPVRMVCDHCGEIPNSQTLHKDDLLIVAWLGDVEKAFRKRSVIFKKVILNRAYDSCDHPKCK